jgi:phasin family protein
MAKKSETTSFIDMFANLGQDLKVPSMDMERIIENHRRNLEALQKTAEAAGASAGNIAQRQREMFEATLREITEMAHGFAKPGTPQEMMTRQIEFARKSLDAFVRNTTEMTELVAKSSEETLDALRKRIREGMDEIQASQNKRS